MAASIFFLISSKPLVGTKQMIHRLKDIVEAHLFDMYFFSLIRYGLRAVSNLLNRGIQFSNFFSNFRYCFRFSFLTVCWNEACNISLKSYGRGATFICFNVFEIPYGFKLISKIVWRTTSGSKRFFAISSKALVGMKQMTHRWKDIVEAHIFHIYYFL